VTTIRQESRGVTVTAMTLNQGARSRRSWSADACICAVPAHRLRHIDWRPALRPEQADAALQLQYSRIMKTAILFENRFWPNCGQTGFSIFTNRASDLCFDSTHGQPGTAGILCSYAIGDKADDLAGETDTDLVRWITEDVVTALGLSGAHPRALDVRRQPWQRDPWTGGAYALYRPGQWFDVRPHLLAPFGRIQFAGEHLADWQGFMEGAVASGEAAADALC
jgi:monoamine oxidase